MRSDDILSRAEEVLQRTRGDRTGKAIAKAGRRAVRATKYGIGGAGLVLIAALILGFFVPLGVTGIMLTFLLMIGALCLAVALSREPDVKPDALPKVALAQLPNDAGRWLDTQRRALPAPAATLADSIGTRLDLLSGQLQAVNEREPVALELRRLIGQELPELVTGYQRVPTNLRREGLNGMSPDRQLAQGLAVVDDELKRISEQIAHGDLNALATQGRYLELKYQGEGAT